MVIIKIEKRTYDNLIFKKVYFLWRNMMQRCYNEKHPSYKYYGNKGVIVNERWHVFNNFIEDIDKINGFNIDKFLKGEIHLDKDLTILGNKEYSLEKCLFVTKEKNNQLKPNQQKQFIAISPEGKIYTSSNQSKFAKEHNLAQNNISMCLKGYQKSHKKWRFKYK